jgi:hypothetical protein
MRRANKADYLNRPSKCGVLDHDAAWLLAGIEPSSIAPEDRDLPVEPQEKLPKETRRMWADENSQLVPEHLRDLVNLAESIMRLIRADHPRERALDQQTAKSLELDGSRVIVTPIERTWAEWVRWANAKKLELPQALRGAMTATTETPKQRRIRLSEEREELKSHGVPDFNQQLADKEGLSLTRFKELADEGDDLRDEALKNKRKKNKRK